jgi:hypothetical protein
MATPMQGSLDRRLTRLAPPPPGRVPTPQITAPTVPTFTAPTQVMPAANVAATPAVDISKTLEQLSPKQEPAPVRDAIGRALYAFSAGYAGTPREAAYSPGGGAAVGALQGLNALAERDRASRAAADEPRRALVQSMLKTQAEEAVRDPYRQAAESREQAGRVALQEKKFTQTKDLFESQAKRKAGERGISVPDYLRMQEQASQEAVLQGLFVGDPGYEAFVDQKVNELAGKAQNLGAPVRTPSPAPKANLPAPKTADEYLLR